MLIQVKSRKEGSDFPKAVEDEFNTLKKRPVKGWETAKEFAEAFSKIINETNKGLTLFNVPEIPQMLIEKNWRLCGECLSSNCQLIQWLSRKNKAQPKFIGACKGKTITLGEIQTRFKSLRRK